MTIWIKPYRCRKWHFFELGDDMVYRAACSVQYEYDRELEEHETQHRPPIRDQCKLCRRWWFKGARIVAETGVTEEARPFLESE